MWSADVAGRRVCVACVLLGAVPLDGLEREVEGASDSGEGLELRGVWNRDEGLPAGHLVLHGQVSAASVPGAAEPVGRFQRWEERRRRNRDAEIGMDIPPVAVVLVCGQRGRLVGAVAARYVRRSSLRSRE